MLQRPRLFLEAKSRTPLWNEVVDALRQLMKDEGEGSADRAFAEAVSDGMYAWMENRGLRESDDMRRCREFHKDINCEDGWGFPGDDHASLWCRDGEPVVYISQPYDLTSDTLREMIAWADRYDLSFAITPRGSWHFPGYTMLVSWTREDQGASEHLTDRRAAS